MTRWAEILEHWPLDDVDEFRLDFRESDSSELVVLSKACSKERSSSIVTGDKSLGTIKRQYPPVVEGELQVLSDPLC